MSSAPLRLLALFLAACAASGPLAGAEGPAPAPAAKKMFAGPKAGDPAPALRALGPDGREVQLADYRGKVVLLDFWATWCAPCIAAMPHNTAYAEKFAADGLVVLAVCVSDTRENFDRWVAQHGASHKFLTAHDPAGRDRKQSAITAEWGVSMLPAIFVVDRDGRIVGRAGGGGPNENPAVVRLLAQAGLPITPATPAHP